MNDTPNVPPGVDPTRPSPARLYDYYPWGLVASYMAAVAPGSYPPYPGAGPAVTYAGLWGAEDPVAADTEGSRGIYCGVARRPGPPAHRESAPGATGGLR